MRNALLSRSVKRENAGQKLARRTDLETSAAWGVSMLLVFGVIAGRGLESAPHEIRSPLRRDDRRILTSAEEQI